MKNILRTTPGKIIIYLLTCIFMLVTIASAGIALFCYDEDMYRKSDEEIREENLNYRTNIALQRLLNNKFDEMSLNGSAISYVNYDDYTNYQDAVPDNLMYQIIDIDGSILLESDGFDSKRNGYIYYLKANTGEGPTWDTGLLTSVKDDPVGNYITAKAYYYGAEGPDDEEFQTLLMIYSKVYGLRYDVYKYGIVCGILSLVFFIMLMCVSARRPGSEEVHPGYFNKLPYDLMLFAAVMLGVILLAVGFDGVGSMIGAGYAGEMLINVIFLCAAIVYAVFAFNGLCMSAAARSKEGSLFTNTVIYKMCKWCLKLIRKYVFGIIRWIWRKIGHMFRGFGDIVKSIPLIWKTIMIFAAVSFIEILALALAWDWSELDLYIMFWVIEHFLLFVSACRFSLGLRGLQAGGRALASGNLDYRVDTSGLKMDFREHGENLNSISLGMQAAVTEKMKSERMKTELITNVSHDIKTPLTSIINYADLIGKEHTDNEKIREYTEVLLRQSERLKRLIEDLVEASKANTGNLEVELVPCQAAMFITQIAGEYEEKLEKAGLTLVTKLNIGRTGTYVDKGTVGNGANDISDMNSVMIMADGRRMLRVFDNLMNNICKYALENSRVYLSMDVIGVDGNAIVDKYNADKQTSDKVDKDEQFDGKYDSSMQNIDKQNVGKRGVGKWIADGKDIIDKRVIDKYEDYNELLGSSGTHEERRVVITFKNTSKMELDMSPEELMERFVRGDQSRNTEGNGLGLSIARSLTELQNGTFDVVIDGDLFKVVLTFPAR